MERINVIKYPSIESWVDLCKRPEIPELDIATIIDDIFAKVGQSGDHALLDYTAKFDHVHLSALAHDVADVEIEEKLSKAIDEAIENITKFHKAQITAPVEIETTSGVLCWRKSVPIEKVGLYIPGGSAPLFSTLLMLAIPARLAGCPNVVVCTPPDNSGNIAPIIEYVANKLGIKKIYKVGGGQAIAAMVVGTETIPQVHKIFGPGNQFVTKAKQKAQSLGVAIDMPAGPSEVLIIADHTANPEFVAADLLSQAEHGPDSQVVLLSDSLEMLEQCQNAISDQLQLLPRNEIASKAMVHSNFILLQDLNSCMDFSNRYAPEHLILATNEPEILAAKVINAGSVFLGHYSCESAGDYASGTNHTLPTNGFAKAYSGVSLDSFVKKITFQKLSPHGIKNLGPAIELMAKAEHLDAHKNAVTVRLKSLKS